MDIELFKTFLEVRNTRHFGNAAKNLYLTQAAVSSRVKQMEDYFSVPLFIRHRNNIQLTAEGERLVPHAETMLLAWSRARQEVALNLEQENQLNIGTTAGLWNYVFQDKLAKIYPQMPHLALRAEAHSCDDLLRLILEQIIDIVLLYDAPNIPELTTVVAGKLKLVLASTATNATTKTALKENYVYVDWGTAFNIFHAKRFNEAEPATLYTSMASIAESFLSENQASAFLPEKMVNESQVENLHIVEGAPSFTRDICLIYRSSSQRLSLINQIVPLLIPNEPD